MEWGGIAEKEILSAEAARGQEIGWTKQFGTSDGDSAWGVAVDTSGNVYVAGFTEGALPGQTSAGERDVFLVKFGEVEPTPSPSSDYTPALTDYTLYLVAGAVAILMIGIVAALYMRRRKPTEFRW